MKIFAILEVDEEMLAQTGHSFEDEMGWIKQSGISLIESVREKEQTGNGRAYEYAAFAWNKESEKYEQIGRPVTTEELCRKRFKECVDKNWLMKCYDTGKVMFRKRIYAIFEGTWEEIKEAESDGE